MDVAPVDKSGGLWLRQAVGGGASNRQKEFWERARSRKFSPQDVKR